MSDERTRYVFTRVGRNIRAQRVKTGMGLRPFSEVCNMDHAALSRIENGKANPTMSTLAKIADALGIDIVVLFEPR